MQLRIGGSAVAMLALLLAGGAAAWWLSRNGPQLAARVGAALDPTSRDNLAYSGVNAIGAAVVDPLGPGRMADGSWSLGAWVYDWTHGMPTIGNGNGATGSW